MPRAEEAFYRLARVYARRWSHKFGLAPDHAEECAQTFVVSLLKPVDPPRWTWPDERIHKFLNTAGRTYTTISYNASNYVTSIADRKLVS